MDSPLPFARGRSPTPRATRSRRVDSPTATSQRRADIQRSRCQALQRFEALELEEIYDPTQTGFADLAGATPVVKSKARLVYTR